MKQVPSKPVSHQNQGSDLNSKLSKFWHFYLVAPLSGFSVQINFIPKKPGTGLPDTWSYFESPPYFWDVISVGQRERGTAPSSSEPYGQYLRIVPTLPLPHSDLKQDWNFEFGDFLKPQLLPPMFEEVFMVVAIFPKDSSPYPHGESFLILESRLHCNSPTNSLWHKKTTSDLQLQCKARK